MLLEGDDVIDRVLRRYGINQNANIVPGFASGSSLPPFSLNLDAKQTELAKSEPNQLKPDEESSINTDDLVQSNRSTFQQLSGELVDAHDNETTIHTSDITPRSMALLAQLKDDLLN